jgi:hypothetical protein
LDTSYFDQFKQSCMYVHMPNLQHQSREAHLNPTSALLNLQALAVLTSRGPAVYTTLELAWSC